MKVLTGLIALGALAFLAAGGEVRAAETAPAQSAPAVIDDVGELGENIYDLAKDQSWDKVAGKLGDLKKGADTLGTQVKEAVDGKAALAKCIAALEKSVPAKDRQTTLQVANQVTMIAADLTDPFHPKTPTDLTRLDFYGRELEIWSAAKDDAKLKASAEALQKTWNRVRHAVVDHKGDKEAKAFDGLVIKLQQCKSPDDFKAIATPILDEVDNLEGVFSK